MRTETPVADGYSVWHRLMPSGDDRCAVQVGSERALGGTVVLLRAGGRVIVETVRTYLEMASPADLRPAFDVPSLRLEPVANAAPLVRELVRRVGAPHPLGYTHPPDLLLNARPPWVRCI